MIVSLRRSSVLHSPPSSTTAAHSSPLLEVTISLSLASNFVFILHLPISSFDLPICLPAFQSRFRFHFICHCVRFLFWFCPNFVPLFDFLLSFSFNAEFSLVVFSFQALACTNPLIYTRFSQWLDRTCCDWSKRPYCCRSSRDKCWGWTMGTWSGGRMLEFWWWLWLSWYWWWLRHNYLVFFNFIGLPLIDDYIYGKRLLISANIYHVKFFRIFFRGEISSFFIQMFFYCTFPFFCYDMFHSPDVIFLLHCMFLMFHSCKAWFFSVCGTMWQVIHKTLNPRWNQTLEFLDDGSPLTLHVREHNALLPTSVSLLHIHETKKSA